MVVLELTEPVTLAPKLFNILVNSSLLISNSPVITIVSSLKGPSIALSFLELLEEVSLFVFLLFEVDLSLLFFLVDFIAELFLLLLFDLLELDFDLSFFVFSFSFLSRSSSSSNSFSIFSKSISSSNILSVFSFCFFVLTVFFLELDLDFDFDFDFDFDLLK